MPAVLRAATSAAALAASITAISPPAIAEPIFESLWTGASITGSRSTLVNAISDDGSTIVGIRNGETYVNRLGTNTRLTHHLSNNSQVFDANRDGTHIVGSFMGSGASWLFDGTDWVLHRTGKIFDHQSISNDRLVIGAEDLGFHDSRTFLVDGTTPSEFNYQHIGSGAPTGLSDDGLAASIAHVGRYVRHAARWSQDTGVEYFASILGEHPEISGSLNISNDGSVVVGYYSIADEYNSFIWHENDYAVIPRIDDDPLTAGEYQAATATTQSGEIVVGTDAGKAYIWSAEAGTRSLKELLEVDYGLDLTGWILEEAVDITYDGTKIVGNGINPGGERAVWAVSNLAPIPGVDAPGSVSEPGTLALLGCSLIGLGIGLRRKLA